MYLPGIRNEFRWDKSALNTFMGFGKWIYMSSVVYFCRLKATDFCLADISTWLISASTVPPRY